MDDLEILDADTIVHKLDKQGFIALYINFDTDKFTIKSKSDGLIDEVAMAMKNKPDLKIKLEGRTDNAGSAGAIRLFPR